MILSIDTTDNVNIKISLEGDGRVLADLLVPAARAQAEELLPAIAKVLSGGRAKLKDIKGIKVASQGGSFTSLRIGVTTANALGYALGVPVFSQDNKAKIGEEGLRIVEPQYDRGPNIGKPRV